MKDTYMGGQRLSNRQPPPSTLKTALIHLERGDDVDEKYASLEKRIAALEVEAQERREAEQNGLNLEMFLQELESWKNRKERIFW
jgi:hypothetical protein